MMCQPAWAPYLYLIALLQLITVQQIQSMAVSIIKYRQKKSNSLFEFYLNYVKELKSISSRIDAVAGYAYQDFLTTNYGFPDVTADNFIVTVPIYPFDKPENTLISYYGRLNYSFKDKYISPVQFVQMDLQDLT